MRQFVENVNASLATLSNNETIIMDELKRNGSENLQKVLKITLADFLTLSDKKEQETIVTKSEVVDGEFAEVNEKTSLSSSDKIEEPTEIVFGSTGDQDKDADTKDDLEQEKEDDGEKTLENVSTESDEEMEKEKIDEEEEESQSSENLLSTLRSLASNVDQKLEHLDDEDDGEDVSKKEEKDMDEDLDKDDKKEEGEEEEKRF